LKTNEEYACILKEVCQLTRKLEANPNDEWLKSCLKNIIDLKEETEFKARFKSWERQQAMFFNSYDDAAIPK
jgi:hypothetical protein